ncbi:MAG: ATP-binding protein [Gemmatimonadota bacterium]|nr:ATP-binding protein [Gemmatimonadota bacterium]
MTALTDGTRPRRDSLSTRRLSGAIFATDALALALTASADSALLLEAVGEDTQVSWANDAARAFFGAPLDGRPSLPTLLLGAGDEVARRRLMVSLESGMSALLDCPVARDDGVRWGEWSVSPLAEDEGAPPRWLVTVRDITDRRRRDQALEIYLRETEQARADAQAQAQQAEALVNELTFARGQAQEIIQQRSAFLASVSHEIRTPLNGVIGLAGVLLGTPLNGEQHEIANALRGSAERLLSLLNDVLDFAKMDSRRMQLESVEFDVHETIEQIVELLAVRPDAKRVRVHTLIAPGVPNLMCGDPGRFGQVLSNLVGNAVKFTPEGRITVRASVDAMDDQHVVLRCEVSDTGIGIAADALERLFEPFVQADAGTTRRYGGTGLGLAICKELVQLMGGTIGVRSTPGEGSVFWFTVQLAVSASAPIRAPQGLDELVNRRALVIERDPENRAIFALQLGGLGLACDGVSSLADAVARLEAAPGTYEFAFVHHDCPDAEPLFAARTIRDLDATHAPVVLILAPLGASPPQAALDAAGAAGLVHTPVRQSMLAGHITDALHRSQSQSRRAATLMAVDDGATAPHWRAAPRVLVAEDNIINQQVAQHMLQLLGCRVDVVANGLEALESVAQVPYDLVFMDCQMPECDGYEATRRLRRGGTGVPVVAMTANVMPGDRQRCLDAGMNDYVSKPVHGDEIDAILRRFLATMLAPDEITDPLARSLTPLDGTPIPRTLVVAPPSRPAAPPAAAPDASAPTGDDLLIDLKIVNSLKAMQARGARKTLIADLMAVFCQQAMEVGDLLQAALDADDPQRVREASHKFKGACGSIGAAQLAARAKDVEMAARENRMTDAAAARDALAALVPIAVAALENAYRDAIV